ncbi:hypothetical protein pVco5_099 [Vibrio phage pVco-5]|uniref:Phosphoribosyl-ATP pyrophosphohydrolase n=1 Tax=Vibrio phage pVco-5 TaxID=1965485 RepID=A0A1W6JV09_9CAUD|nr:hypothetical protein KNT61_gp099 [Vibrio phage pVco-5]ARM71087.1 hypothetical protein pVco5_099 [Vibrio phage pVco-5]
MTDKSIDLNAMFAEFNDTYGYEPITFNSPNLKKAVKLISDEVVEILLESEAEELDQLAAAKELTDNLYITMQQMSAMGLDIGMCLREVHRSNLSKTVPLAEAPKYVEEVKDRYPNVAITNKGDRAVLRCVDTGKVIKPSCYSPAEITTAMISPVK